MTEVNWGGEGREASWEDCRLWSRHEIERGRGEEGEVRWGRFTRPRIQKGGWGQERPTACLEQRISVAFKAIKKVSISEMLRMFFS